MAAGMVVLACVGLNVLMCTLSKQFYLPAPLALVYVTGPAANLLFMICALVATKRVARWLRAASVIPYVVTAVITPIIGTLAIFPAMAGYVGK